MTQEKPKRGVSLYSYQQEYYLREMTLEDCIRVSAELGAFGIETIAEQMMPGFPDLSDGFYEQWHGWMEQYGTTPTAHDLFLDTMLYKDRLLSTEEMLESVRRDIDHAARLGCSVIRVIVMTPPEILEQSIPYAAEKGVKLALEIHSPRHFDDEWIQKHYAVFERHGPEHVGFMPDMGIFVQRFPRVISDRSIREGATPDLVAHIVDAYDSAADAGGVATTSLKGLQEEIEARGGNDQDVGLARMASHFVWSDPERLREFMPFVHHVHAKFYEMTDEGREYSIPYEEIVPIFVESGYTGYFSSEYEGQRHIQDAFEVDSVEQVRRQQRMLAGIFGEEG
jgi:sugar phosphate isomerase/epimerase